MAETDLIKEQMKKVRAAFPSLPKEFYLVLHDRVVSKEMTAQQLIDSVNRVIDTCHYPTPTIADFVSHDIKIKLYTYYEMIKMVEEWGGEIWNDYTPVTMPGSKRKLWAAKKQAEKYNLNDNK